MLLLIAFTVVAGTLFIQGLTLPWFARRLARAVARPARGRAGPRDRAAAGVEGRASSALHELEDDDQHEVLDVLKQRIEQRNFAAWERLGTTADQETPERALLRGSGWR